MHAIWLAALYAAKNNRKKIVRKQHRLLQLRAIQIAIAIVTPNQPLIRTKFCKGIVPNEFALFSPGKRFKIIFQSEYYSCDGFSTVKKGNCQMICDYLGIVIATKD